MNLPTCHAKFVTFVRVQCFRERRVDNAAATDDACFRVEALKKA